MTAPNRNTYWASVLLDELASAGLSSVCVAPGSRSTPLTLAVNDNDGIEVFSHLDERSAGFFALGRAKRSGEPVGLICTSGTAAANFHPAVIEAHESRVPLVVLTADRPPELTDSGANQTIDQTDLYGDAVRWARVLPEPEITDRKLRRLRVDAVRALSTAMGPPSGSVHLNVPFRKPLEPTPVAGDVPPDFADEYPLAAHGRDGPFVSVTTGKSILTDHELDDIAMKLGSTARGLIVVGPTGHGELETDALSALATATGYPVLADPLSNTRFGPHVSDTTVLGGYDSILAGDVQWATPELVVRFGAAPTSKTLREFLQKSGTHQLLVDETAGWRDDTFTVNEFVVSDPTRFATAVAERLDGTKNPDWHHRFVTAEETHWSIVDDAPWFEGTVLADVTALAPDHATLFVSNSMPVRDLDRYGKPSETTLTVLGNRGASGIDGITSSALGAGSATDDPLVLVTGDLAYYHDMNGLLATTRCDVGATIVLVNNDGGGIFHKLPIEDFDPPFTDLFKTPHGLDFAPSSDLYDVSFTHADDRDAFRTAFRDAINTDGTDVIEVTFDARDSHDTREHLQERLLNELA